MHWADPLHYIKSFAIGDRTKKNMFFGSLKDSKWFLEIKWERKIGHR